MGSEYSKQITKKDKYVFLVGELKKIKFGDKIKVEDIEHEAIFMASYVTEHYPDNQYLKVFFEDGTALEIYDREPFYEVDAELFFYDSSLREFKDESFTDYGETLEVDGKEYMLNDSFDKRYIEKVFFGETKNGEGESITSIYVGRDGFWLIEEGNVAKGRFGKRVSVEDVDLIF